MLEQIRIIVAQVATKTGNLAANTAKACAVVRAARDCDLIVFPELFVTGYPPEDLLFQVDMPQRLELAKQQLAKATLANSDGESVELVIGAPTYINGTIYNSAWHFSGGKLAHIYHKQLLPNYGVFDEKRYFSSGDTTLAINLRGRLLMLLICEDIWGEGVEDKIEQVSPELVVAINSSPFENGKLEKRQTRVCGLAAQTKTAWLYANLYGAQDELVFDGASFCVDRQGKLAGQARELAPHLWRVKYRHNQWVDTAPSVGLGSTTKIFYALVIASAAYVRASSANGVVLGLSGGIDSALCLAIAVAALGANRVKAIILPYIHTREISITDARKQAKLLGVKPIELPIHAAVDGVVASIQQQIDFDSKGGMLALQNIQARCRANILMSIANAENLLLLVTSNKSELAMGYGTLYGDMAGAYAVLKDIDKQTVYELARWCNRNTEQIVTRIIEREPSAELAADQLDSDTLPEYVLLDKFVKGYIEEGQSLKQLSELCDAKQAHQLITSMDRNEYKRRQAPIGPKITKLAFGRDRRMPITNYWQH